jgi:hypothetical protein
LYGKKPKPWEQQDDALFEDFVMNVRNAKYNAYGTIDCEIDHPVYGWIPFTASSDDVEPLGVAVFQAAQGIAEAFAPPPDPSEAEVLAAWRSTATVSRAEFVIACVGAGILTEADGEKAATGEWPDAFNGFLTGMDFAGRVRARAEWKDNATIRRLAPTLLALQAVAKLTDEQVDALFGRVA